MDLLELAMTLVALGVGAAVWYVRSQEREAFNEMLLDGATLSEVPSLKELLTNPAAREAIKARVVAVGYDAGFNHGDGLFDESAPEDVFVVDDGGAVHSLKISDYNSLLTRTTAGRLESKAAELAKLLGVDFRS